MIFTIEVVDDGLPSSLGGEILSIAAAVGISLDD